MFCFVDFLIYIFMDGELWVWFQSSSLCLPILPFQLTELLPNTVEPGCWLPCTGCVMAEKGVLVKDGTEMVIVVPDKTGWWDGFREVLFNLMAQVLIFSREQHKYCA